MKIAASRALAELAKLPVPQSICEAYAVDHLEFGTDYIVPKALDPRICLWEAPAVAQAAIESGVARKALDMEDYRTRLSERFTQAC